MSFLKRFFNICSHRFSWPRTDNQGRDYVYVSVAGLLLFTTCLPCGAPGNCIWTKRREPITDDGRHTFNNQAAKSILVMEGGSVLAGSFPSRLILASSAFSSAPTSMANPVQ